MIETVASKVAVSLATGIVKQVGKRLARELRTPQAQEALESCSKAGVVALVRAGCPEDVELDEELRRHLEGVLGAFAEDEDVHDILAGAIRSGDLPEDEVEELRKRFREVHAPEVTLPGFDVARGVAGFVVGFIDRADQEPVFQGVIQTTALRDSVRLQRELLAEAREHTGLLERRVEQEEEKTRLQEKILDRMPDRRREAAEARVRYLERIRRDCLRLPVSRLLLEQGLEDSLTLDRVYVELDTKTPKEKQGQGKEGRWRPVAGSEPEVELLSAADALADERRLVILGDPGSGKSTFARAALAQLAASALAEGAEPPAGLSRDLVPLFVVLRELSGRLGRLDLAELNAEQRERSLAEAVRQDVLAALPAELADEVTEGILTEALTGGRCLVVFDGLDEVPEDRRGLVREAVLAAADRFAPERLLVTCRVRSYTGTATLPGFTAHELAPLDEGGVRSFCGAWYRALGKLGGVAEERVEDEAEDLVGAALAPSLVKIAENPLLLTTMAVLHTRKAELPRERVRVFERSIELLVRDWQRERVGKKLVDSAELRELLLDDSRLWPLLQRVAYEAHRVGGTEREVAAGLSEGDLLALLKRPEHLGSAALAEEFLGYAEARAGLLVGQGGEPGEPAAFGFVHRTFQEYLAGRHVTTGWDPVEELHALAAEGDLWSVAVELGSEALLYVDRSPKRLLGLAFGLGGGRSVESEQAQRAALWAGRMAALVGREAVERERHGPVAGQEFLQALRPKLVTCLGRDLPAIERAEAGRALGRLGDPREEVTSVDAMELCLVPAGPFLMGSREEDEEALERQKPQRRVEVPYDCWASRYPVTQAQFQAFVDDGGYGERRFWLEAEEAGVWVTGSEFPSKPARVGELYDLENHPVVGVSWYEAAAFCRWLTERWRARGWLPEGWEVRLPREAEWEKAARGGLVVPSAFHRSRIDQARLEGKGRPDDGAVETNPEPERRWPWGGEWSAERANGSPAGIGSTSAVGCFAGGASPYGCEEMAGNVWEWCADPMRPYKGAKEIDPAAPERTASRVVRGGSFLFGPRWLGVVCRGDYLPEDRYLGGGFRLSCSSRGGPSSRPSGPRWARARCGHPHRR